MPGEQGSGSACLCWRLISGRLCSAGWLRSAPPAVQVAKQSPQTFGGKEGNSQRPERQRATPRLVRCLLSHECVVTLNCEEFERLRWPPLATQRKGLTCLNNGCLFPCAFDALVAFCGFAIISMAGHMFGKALAPLGLPTITVFIGFGLACGPFGLELIDARSSTLLSWINPFALSFIGFSAGDTST